MDFIIYTVIYVTAMTFCFKVIGPFIAELFLGAAKDISNRMDMSLYNPYDQDWRNADHK